MSQALVTVGVELTEKQSQQLDRAAFAISQGMDQGQKIMWEICEVAYQIMNSMGEEALMELSRRIFQCRGHKIHWKNLKNKKAKVFERFQSMAKEHWEVLSLANYTTLEKLVRVKNDETALRLLTRCVADRWPVARLEKEIMDESEESAPEVYDITAWEVIPREGHIVDCRVALEKLEAKGWLVELRKVVKHGKG